MPQQSVAPLAGPLWASLLLHVNVLAYGLYGRTAPCHWSLQGAAAEEREQPTVTEVQAGRGLKSGSVGVSVCVWLFVHRCRGKREGEGEGYTGSVK